jgi:pantothenate kinase
VSGHATAEREDVTIGLEVVNAYRMNIEEQGMGGGDGMITTGEAIERARELASRGRRTLLGITGPPGGGKSTLAQAVADELSDRACLVGMDGFHLAQAELVRLGRRDRMGALDTFDGAGYVALLRRLRAADEVVYAPEFRREIEEPINGAVAVPPDVPLVITEGNYLLVDEGPWAEVRELLDEAWYVVQDEETRLRLLIDRHVEFGKEPDFAREWVMRSDQRNAELVEATRERADALVRITIV